MDVSTKFIFYKISDCVDYSHGCMYWAKDGWCEKSQWMRDNCKNSCNICKV